MKRMIAIFALSLSACAQTAPSKLFMARRAYRSAELSPAKRFAQVELLRAEKALKCAEQAHGDSPGSLKEQHCVYLTVRYAEHAQLQAEIRQAKALEEDAREQLSDPIN